MMASTAHGTIGAIRLRGAQARIPETLRHPRIGPGFADPERSAEFPGAQLKPGADEERERNV